MPALYQGIRIAAGGRADSRICNTPEAHRRREQQRAKLDFLDQINREHAAAHPRTNANSKRASPATNSLSACRPKRPEAVELAKETDATKELYGIGREGDGDVRRHVPARAAARRARRALRAALSRRGQQVGRARRRSRRTTANFAARSTNRSPGLLKDLKARGLLDDDARRLGRRIRPHADERERRRPRSQSDRLHDVDGRRRRERRPDDRRDG